MVGSSTLRACKSGDAWVSARVRPKLSDLYHRSSTRNTLCHLSELRRHAVDCIEQTGLSVDSIPIPVEWGKQQASQQKATSQAASCSV